LIIIGAGIVTIIPRVVPLVLLSRVTLPEGVVRWLGYVPIAVLAALLAQAVVLSDGQIALPPRNLAMLAIVPVLLVAVRTRSLIGTVVSGVAAMALLRWLLS
jgi:branched-subunit amino acid transport protein